jgi:lipopolysaccharide/colanic/teichoic acid biosynthesis glycosyltransferase
MQRWELERLPELWNVITGDLALVGVRPMSPVEVASLQEAWEQKRNEYPAGFTGLWYVHGTHSHGLEASLLEASLIDDAYYTATRSWQGDLVLICRTPQAWWRRRRLQSARPPVTQEYFSQVDEMSGT